MALIAADITAGYGRRAAVAKAHLEVQRGEVVGLIGANGSGKSTLVRCIARALRPFQGKVLVDGDDLYHLPAAKSARRVAYVPQETPMPYAFTVQELVGLYDASGRERENEKPRMERVLAQMDLEPLIRRSVLSLSGGERQRAALARGLAQGAAYLLLDEPTTHLDLRHQVAILEAAREAAREPWQTGVLVVLHDLSLAGLYCDRLYVLYQGQVVDEGEPGEVLTEEKIERWFGVRVTVEQDTHSERPMMRLQSLGRSGSRNDI